MYRLPPKLSGRFWGLSRSVAADGAVPFNRSSGKSIQLTPKAQKSAVGRFAFLVPSPDGAAGR
jgi:hypothetical protein